ncbi:MAG: DUF4168 domain-containing protein [Leptolyngbyaceae cyanobacterium SM2_5_2]|nr:DUF4168 domain-containing protein [Leptolyngbyaceae cyanobacterium SM2_5_2]
MKSQATITKSVRSWSKSLAVALLVAAGSVMASASPLPLPVVGEISLSAAWARDLQVSPEEIMGYARSVLEMEGPRTEAYNKIRELLTGTNYDINTIDLRCTATNRLNQLPRNVRGSVRAVIVDYCNQASEIVQANGLRNDRFDAITAAYPEDPALAEQIRTAMVQLQQQSQNQARPANGSGQ